MKIGDRRREIPLIEGIECRLMDCVVVYIHPQRRFYTVEFTGPAPNSFKFRESYFFKTPMHRRMKEQ